MAIGNLLKINNVTPPGLKGYTVMRGKLFTDAGRNLKGSLKADFVGVVPKLQLQFPYLTQAQMSTLITLLEPSTLLVAWWDEMTDTIKSGNFYAGDYEITLYRKETGMYQGVSVNLISYDPL